MLSLELLKFLSSLTFNPTSRLGLPPPWPGGRPCAQKGLQGRSPQVRTLTFLAHLPHLPHQPCAQPCVITRQPLKSDDIEKDITQGQEGLQGQPLIAWGFVVSCQLARLAWPHMGFVFLNACPERSRRVAILPPASFRPHLTVTPLPLANGWCNQPPSETFTP